MHRHTLAVCLVLALLGCGQKGPLYLPEEEPAPTPAPADPLSETLPEQPVPQPDLGAEPLDPGLKSETPAPLLSIPLEDEEAETEQPAPSPPEADEG